MVGACCCVNRPNGHGRIACQADTRYLAATVRFGHHPRRLTLGLACPDGVSHSGDLLFAGKTGGYLPRPKSSNGWFTRAVTAAKVQAITPHDLRHTCATLAVSAGVNVLALARMLGHKDPPVTLRVYADLFDTDLDAVAATLHARYPPKCAQNVLTAAQDEAK